MEHRKGSVFSKENPKLFLFSFAENQPCVPHQIYISNDSLVQKGVYSPSTPPGASDPDQFVGIDRRFLSLLLAHVLDAESRTGNLSEDDIVLLEHIRDLLKA